jgi:hypothetical protein
LHMTSDEKVFLYENVSAEFFTSDFNCLRPFSDFSDSSKLKRK